MAGLLFNITWEQGEPSIEDICRRYDLDPQELDSQFGIIKIDGVYCILVDEEAAERIGENFRDDPSIEGPFSNVGIDTFGPPI
jgi:hypothetical protein